MRARMKLESAEKKNRSLEAQLQEALDRIEQLEQQDRAGSRRGSRFEVGLGQEQAGEPAKTGRKNRN